MAPFDYSQPLVINNFVTQEQPVETPQTENALTIFDDALDAFYLADYQGALNLINQAIKEEPNDPIMHEVRALALFALGQFKEAAGVLNWLLASAPGMDWSTMSGLYGNVEDYTAQLRRLEEHVKGAPNDASARFVLAYHYLVLGHVEEALPLLQKVVELEPRDTTARRMIETLSPPPEGAETPKDKAGAAETDLVGSWKAAADKTVVELSIGEDFSFKWRATIEGQPTIELEGVVDSFSDWLILETEKEGTMAGRVESGGNDSFTFHAKGAAPNDPGLVFKRQ